MFLGESKNGPTKKLENWGSKLYNVHFKSALGLLLFTFET